MLERHEKEKTTFVPLTGALVALSMWEMATGDGFDYAARISGKECGCALIASHHSINRIELISANRLHLFDHWWAGYAGIRLLTRYQDDSLPHRLSAVKYLRGRADWISLPVQDRGILCSEDRTSTHKWRNQEVGSAWASSCMCAWPPRGASDGMHTLNGSCAEHGHTPCNNAELGTIHRTPGCRRWADIQMAPVRTVCLDVLNCPSPHGSPGDRSQIKLPVDNPLT
eukprot:scaffold9563_cov39-Tisochrysis_lutea.AAC.1